MIKTDLEFLLKEKYGYSATEVFLFFKEFPEIITKPKKHKEEVDPNLYAEIIKLNKNYPVDYLIGYKQFINSTIYLNEKTLVPRAETEYWVNKVLDEEDFNTKKSVLDIFAGSGCIGIAVLKKFRHIVLVSSDFSLQSVKQIKENMIKNNISADRYFVIKSDIFAKLKKSKFDVIFANPPYISTEDTTVGEELKYEPKEALFSGIEGLDVITRFIEEAYKYLNLNGYIFMEFGSDQKEKIDSVLNGLSVYKKWTFHKDQFGRDRWVKIEI